MVATTISVDEVAAIIGHKELELYQARKELAETRRVLADVTAGDRNGDETEANDGAESPR
jgi:hypothetical protein